MRFASIKQIEIVGEAANYITPETKELFSDIEWKQIIGMRHILIHEYFGVDANLDGIVLSKLPDKLIRFPSIASSGNGSVVIFNKTDFIDSIGFLPKEISALISYQCKNGPAHRNPWLALMCFFFPCFFEQPDLFCLLHVERLAAFVEFQDRTLQVHSVYLHFPPIGN